MKKRQHKQKINSGTLKAIYILFGVLVFAFMIVKIWGC